MSKYLLTTQAMPTPCDPDRFGDIGEAFIGMIELECARMGYTLDEWLADPTNWIDIQFSEDGNTVAEGMIFCDGDI